MKIIAVVLKNDSAIYGLRWTKESAEKLAEFVIASSRNQLDIEDFSFQELAVPSLHVKLKEILDQAGIELMEPGHVFSDNEYLLLLKAYLGSYFSGDPGYKLWEDPVLNGVEMTIRDTPEKLLELGIPLKLKNGMVAKDSEVELLNTFS
jgi:hypothetical protein